MMTPLEARLTEENAALRQEIKLLREKIDLLIRRIFGKSSEQLDDNQLMLLLQGGDDGAKKDPASSASPGALEAEIKQRGKDSKPVKPRKEREARVPEHLPAVDEVIEPEEVTAAPEAWRHIGEEVTEQLDYQPARFLRRRIIRRKYVKRDEPHQAPIIAALNILQERSIAAPGLLAQIIVAKYCDHLPLYRQEQIYATRHDIHIPRQSMARWLGLAADWLRPVYEHIHTGVMAGGYVQVDETPVEYLSPGNGQTKQGYLWACKRPGADVSFTWTTSRAALCLERIIPADFTGTVQCDGYQAYPSFAKRSEGRITLATCWAHARLQVPRGHRERSAARWLAAAPNPAPLSYRTTAAHDRCRPAATSGQQSQREPHEAQPSASAQKRHGPRHRLRIDALADAHRVSRRRQNRNRQQPGGERHPSHRRRQEELAVHRGSRSRSAQRSAVLFTIIEACRSRGIDPQTYLRDLLTRLPTMTNRQTKDVTPAAWAKAQEPAAQRRAA